MHPEKHEVEEIYQLWKTYFGFDDGGSIDDYFKRNFTLETCYVLRKEHTIAACLCAHPHTMMLQGKQVPIRFISGVITKKEFQHRGYMKELFSLVFADDPKCALWVLQAYQPRIYASLGFLPTYFANVYVIEPESLLVKNGRITEVYDTQILSTFASHYLSAYDGYIQRDEAWYENILLETQARGGKILGSFIENELTAYAICFQEEDVISIEEVMYQDIQALENLLAHITATSTPIEFVTPAYLPYAKQSDKCTLLVRLGNIETLKNIFQTNITCLKDVYIDIQTLYHYGFW